MEVMKQLQMQPVSHIQHMMLVHLGLVQTTEVLFEDARIVCMHHRLGDAQMLYWIFGLFGETQFPTFLVHFDEKERLQTTDDTIELL